MASPGMPESRPRLLKGGADGAPEPGARRRGRSRGLLWLLGALLVMLLGAALLQTERLDRLREQADGLRSANSALQAELADAQARLQGYEQQRALVRESVADLAQRVGALAEFVRADGDARSAPPASAEPEPTGERRERARRGALKRPAPALQAVPAAPPPAEGSAQLPHPEGR